MVQRAPLAGVGVATGPEGGAVSDHGTVAGQLWASRHGRHRPMMILRPSQSCRTKDVVPHWLRDWATNTHRHVSKSYNA
jgi:hypothetical protein